MLRALRIHKRYIRKGQKIVVASKPLERSWAFQGSSWAFQGSGCWGLKSCWGQAGLINLFPQRNSLLGAFLPPLVLSSLSLWWSNWKHHRLGNEQVISICLILSEYFTNKYIISLCFVEWGYFQSSSADTQSFWLIKLFCCFQAVTFNSRCRWQTN